MILKEQSRSSARGVAGLRRVAPKKKVGLSLHPAPLAPILSLLPLLLLSLVRICFVCTA